MSTSTTTRHRVPPALAAELREIEDRQSRHEVGAKFAFDAAAFFEERGGDASHARRNAEQSRQIAYALVCAGARFRMALTHLGYRQPEESA